MAVVQHLVAAGRIAVVEVLHDTLASESECASRRANPVGLFRLVDERFFPVHAVDGGHVGVEPRRGSQFLSLVFPEMDPCLEKPVLAVVDDRSVGVEGVFLPWKIGDNERITSVLHRSVEHLGETTHLIDDVVVDEQLFAGEPAERPLRRPSCCGVGRAGRNDQHHACRGEQTQGLAHCRSFLKIGNQCTVRIADVCTGGARCVVLSCREARS